MNKSSTKIRQADWRGLLIFDVIGNRFHLTTRELWRALMHRYLILFVILTTTALVLWDTHGFRDILSISETIIVWSVCVISLIGFYAFITSIMIETAKRFTRVFVYFPLIGFFCMTINTFLTDYNVSLISGQTFSIDRVYSHLPFNLSIGLVFETIFVVFVFPIMRSNSEYLKPIENTTITMTIAGQKFNTNEILSIESQDHYVEISTTSSKSLLRARIADIATMLSHIDGIMPHRSYWVSRNAIKGMSSSSNKKTLILTSGEQIPIARGRVAKVQDWLENEKL